VNCEPKSQNSCRPAGFPLFADDANDALCVLQIRSHHVERMHVLRLQDPAGYDGGLAAAREIVGSYMTFEQWSKQSRADSVREGQNGQ
jgi:hypothetical protein